MTRWFIQYATRARELKTKCSPQSKLKPLTNLSRISRIAHLTNFKLLHLREKLGEIQVLSVGNLNRPISTKRKNRPEDSFIRSTKDMKNINHELILDLTGTSE